MNSLTVVNFHAKGSYRHLVYTTIISTSIDSSLQFRITLHGLRYSPHLLIGDNLTRNLLPRLHNNNKLKIINARSCMYLIIYIGIRSYRTSPN